jgi:hypothetical protein
MDDFHISRQQIRDVDPVQKFLLADTLLYSYWVYGRNWRARSRTEGCVLLAKAQKEERIRFTALNCKASHRNLRRRYVQFRGISHNNTVKDLHTTQDRPRWDHSTPHREWVVHSLAWRPMGRQRTCPIQTISGIQMISQLQSSSITPKVSSVSHHLSRGHNPHLHLAQQRSISIPQTLQT